MRILISGGAGFVGSHTARDLDLLGHKVMVVDNFSTGCRENLEGFGGRVELVDISHFGIDLHDCFSSFLPDAVLHLAGQSAITTSINNPAHDLTVNGIGTINLLKLAKHYSVNRFVFSSTSAVYREARPFLGVGITEKCLQEPASPYGISKLAAEHYVRTMFSNHLILRYGNIYGPRQKPIGDNQLIARVFRHLIHGDDFKVVGNGKQKRDFVYVDDIVYANFMALMSGVTGTFNACTGRSHSVNEVLQTLEDIFGLPSHYGWEHTAKNDPRGDVFINPSAIRRELGWSASVTLREGLKKTAEWWEKK